MARTLTAGVIVCHPGSGEKHFLPTGSVLPEWATELVGDHVLSTPSAPPLQVGAPVVAKPPRRSGPGSSAKAWRAYATEQGLHVEADADRDDVIAMLDQADLPT